MNIALKTKKIYVNIYFIFNLIKLNLINSKIMNFLICPICRKKHDSNGPERPFCSGRCKELDLLSWFDDVYYIAGHDNEFIDINLEKIQEGDIKINDN